MINSYWVIPNAFSDYECDLIIDQYKSKVDAAKVGHTFEEGQIKESIRRSNVTFVDDVHLIKRLTEIGLDINRNGFAYDIYSGVMNDVQFTEYDSAYQGKYDYHMDCGFSSPYAVRKLSLIVQLSDPNSYEGGRFYVNSGSIETTEDAWLGRGTIFAIPSYMHHKVTPVTRGIRYSLVTWLEGPMWR